MENEIKFLNSEIRDFKECLEGNPRKEILRQWIKDSIEVFEERIINLQKCKVEKSKGTGGKDEYKI